MADTKTEKSVTKTAAKLSLLAVSMFVFAIYVLPPVYDVFCEITGLNGKGSTLAAAPKEVDVDEARTVRVTFIATNNEQMPWEFKPNDAVMVVKPGEIANTSYFAKNTTERNMVSRAVPSFVPNTVGSYFKKMECFCFNNQPLAAGESADLSLQFYVDPDLPEKITNITLSYTIFDITETETAANIEYKTELSSR
ncbi:cytochrome c oxidase assembly protein [Aurantivibrio infirmus]